MTVFEETCLLSCEQWVDSFPSDIPKHKFSKHHNDNMKKILDENQQKEKYKLSKKTIRFLVAAAILLSLTITTFAIPSCREFIITKFFNHSEYIVSDIRDAKPVKSLTVNYVPNGFEKVEDYGYSSVYRNGDEEFVVEKSMLTASIGYDTEFYDDEIIKINGTDAVYYKSNDVNGGIIFNNGKYIFSVDGNISKEELVKIAQNIE